jgi:hypothetical protein
MNFGIEVSETINMAIKKIVVKFDEWCTWDLRRCSFIYIYKKSKNLGSIEPWIFRERERERSEEETNKRCTDSLEKRGCQMWWFFFILNPTFYFYF